MWGRKQEVGPGLKKGGGGLILISGGGVRVKSGREFTGLSRRPDACTDAKCV